MGQQLHTNKRIYDRHFDYSRSEKRQRKELWKYLKLQLGNKPCKVLLLNCGSGVDAIFLAKRGHEVIAADRSGEMVKAAWRKVAYHGLKDQITVLQLAWNELDEHFLGKDFDLVLANFGHLNSLSHSGIKRFAFDVSGLLAPDGHLIAIATRGRGLAIGQNDPTIGSETALMEELNGTGIVHWPYHPDELKSWFDQAFLHLHTRALGLFLPGPQRDMSDRTLDLLDQLSAPFNEWRSLAPFAQHYLMDFQLR